MFKEIELPELPKLPGISDLGINKVNEGPPVPKALNIKWPAFIGTLMKEKWPGAPFPRKWGEAVMDKLPLGLGKGVKNVVNSLGL